MLLDVPLEEDDGGWEREMDIQVVPISLSQFWDAFLANDAPYYYLALVDDHLDRPYLLVENEDWGQPSEGEEVIWGKDVVQERMLERFRARKHNLFCQHIHEEVYLSLVEKTDTKITLKESTIYKDLNFYRGFEFWVKWEIVTDDPRSQQVALRQSYVVKWYDKPWGLGKLINWEVMTDFREDNKKFEDFFTQSADSFKAGAPYKNQTQDPEQKAYRREHPDEQESSSSDPSKPTIVIPDINPEYTPEEDLDIETEQPVVIVKPEDILPVYNPDEEPEGTDIF